ncbi:DUF2244 domain-containing protein [Janthinobacterium fluminis]|uniref:DUF2244 domain-containing protein n=1 Tax=Janthinobacterium fluminis TaxID=2987524 RepID=A0ABT5JXV2_9BURK|nr:DUF2244 domain-containing protein [Janthinobacterium fluminis]MDC8757568.1 DUF2244 domain-containing protein [Janthinobacterium fluminis]
MPRDAAMHQPEWLLKRNCSLSPRQLGMAYGVLCLLSFAIAAAFALSGYWYVPVFSIVEMGAVACAMLYYARHAADYEHIALRDNCLLIEQVRAGQMRQTRLDPYWTRIGEPRRDNALIRLEARGVAVEVGRFVTDARRRQVARELQHYLPGSRLR